MDRSQNVQTRITGWIDYDRYWLLRRQLLVSEHSASVLSNLVAIALTLVGPRFWILVKACLFWAFHAFGRWQHTRRRHPSARNSRDHRSAYVNHNLSVTAASHSELGAAQGLVEGVFEELRIGEIELPATQTTHERHRLDVWSREARKVWQNFARQPLDIIASLLLSIIFVAIFVAEATSSVLSTNIITDSVALISSPNCSYSGDIVTGTPNQPWLQNILHANPATAYREQCYNAPSGTDGCNFFYNSTISYKDIVNDTCPFSGSTCAQGRNGAYSFDTDWIDAKYIGINAAHRYQFKRKTTCAPLVPDGRHITILNDWILEVFDCMSWSLITVSWDAFTAFARSNDMSLCPKAFDTRYTGELSNKAGMLTLIRVLSSNIYYSEYRDDPVFPANTHKGYAYYNNSTLLVILGCVDTTEILDPTLGTRWVIQPTNGYNQYLPQQGNSAVTKADMAWTLLAIAITNSNIENSFQSARGRLEVEYYCGVSMVCHLPREQWIVEARRWFEISLAQIQYNVLEIARDPDSKFNHSIPPEYRGICEMSKFRSTGWRNVSIWGLLGLLSLTVAIWMASIEMDNGDLLLLVAAKYVQLFLLWSFKKLKIILWALDWREIYRVIAQDLSFLFQLGGNGLS